MSNYDIYGFIERIADAVENVHGELEKQNELKRLELFMNYFETKCKTIDYNKFERELYKIME